MKGFNSKSGRYTKKRIAVVMCALMMVSMLAGNHTVNASQVNSSTVAGYGDTTQNSATTEDTKVDANGTLGKNSDIGVEVTKSITATAGKKVKVAFKLNSNDKTNIKLKSVYPVIDTTFPFETSGDAYKVITAGSDTAKQAELAASYSLTARSDLASGYQSVRFIGEYSKMASDGTVSDYYVIKTINIYFASAGSGSTGTNSGNSGGSGNGSLDDDDDPAYGDGDDSDYPDTGSSGSNDEATAPKLIITGYETNPKKIMAGQTFTIKIHVQNTSKSIPVCNGKFLIGNEAGNFLPTSGSSAIFVESIPAGKTEDIEIEMKTSADLAQKNYIMVVKGDFDDGKGNTFTSSDNLSIPVYQEVRLGVTDVSMTPESIGIGSSGSLMFTINNQGSAGVYNVKATVKDDAVTGEESSVGNIAANSSAYATLNIVGAQDNSDTGTIKILISYEDSEGNVGELEQDVACLVGVDAEMEEFDEMEAETLDEETTGLPWWLILLIVLAVLAVIIVVVFVIVKKRKKRMAELFTDEDESDEYGEDDLENEDF